MKVVLTTWTWTTGLLAADRVAPYAMTPGRLGGSVAALVALFGLVTGALALSRARRTGNELRRGTVALVAGLIGMTLGGVVVATARGGLGTGSGLAGGIVAIVVGLIGTALGALARARSRPTG